MGWFFYEKNRLKRGAKSIKNPSSDAKSHFVAMASDVSAPVAQLVEHLTFNPVVTSSNLVGRTISLPDVSPKIFP